MPYFLDGDNVVGTVLGHRTAAGDREALAREIADRLRRTQARVVLFFDGAGERLSLGPLVVRFAGAISADDAIVREISRASQPGETTVVTADRELARRARDAGAVVMSPKDFWDRFGQAPARTSARDEPRVDVEEWLQWFSDEANRER